METTEKLKALEMYCNNQLANGDCEGCVFVVSGPNDELYCSMDTSNTSNGQIELLYSKAFPNSGIPASKEMRTVHFPQGIIVDVEDIPADFEEKILVAFKGFARGADPKYLNHCKLTFIECCVGSLRNAQYGNDAVKGMILKRVEQELDERGIFPDRSSVLNLDFMVDCFEKGRETALLYSDYTPDRETNEKIMELLFRAIKVVINYEAGE